MKLQNLFALLDIENFLFVSALILVTWGFYKVLLRSVSEERHRNLANHYKNLFRLFVIFSSFFASFELLKFGLPEDWAIYRLVPYLALSSYFLGLVVFVKTCRVFTLQYLFLGSMRHGVPLLIVNIFSLMLSIGLALASANYIFGINVTPLLATSAAFSIVLGLAMQDTLGNLFAGIALQLDKPYEIGDWIEVIHTSQKSVGQVKEISWRSTILVGWSDELIIIPNRVLSNSQVSNYSLPDNSPFCRSQLFRISYTEDLAQVKRVLLESIRNVAQIKIYPEPVCIITETHESWLLCKLVYYIDNFGSQYSIGDKVVESAMSFLNANRIRMAHPIMDIHTQITPSVKST